MSAEAIPDRSCEGVLTHATMPAQLRYLEVLRLVVRIAMEGWGIDGDRRTDIGLAVDELASVLILQVGSVGELHLTAGHDRQAVHIELTASDPHAGPLPVLDALSQQLLDATTDHHAVERRGSDLVVRLRRRLVSRSTGAR